VGQIQRRILRQDPGADALFLQPDAGTRRFTTTGEAQGVIEIPTTPEDRTIKTHSGLPALSNSFTQAPEACLAAYSWNGGSRHNPKRQNRHVKPKDV